MEGWQWSRAVRLIRRWFNGVICGVVGGVSIGIMYEIFFYEKRSNLRKGFLRIWSVLLLLL